jgi:hypothetical protein
MLRIYPVMLEWLKGLAPLIAQIARFDGDLAKQLRRASASVILNTGEECTRAEVTARTPTALRCVKWARVTRASGGSDPRLHQGARAAIRRAMPADSRNAREVGIAGSAVRGSRPPERRW